MPAMRRLRFHFTILTNALHLRESIIHVRSCFPIKSTDNVHAMGTGWACARHKLPGPKLKTEKNNYATQFASFFFLVDQILGCRRRRCDIHKWRSTLRQLNETKWPENGFDIEIANHKWMLRTHARSLSFTRLAHKTQYRPDDDLYCAERQWQQRWRSGECESRILSARKSIACAPWHRRERTANCNLLCIKLWSKSEPLLALWCMHFPIAMMAEMVTILRICRRNQLDFTRFHFDCRFATKCVQCEWHVTTINMRHRCHQPQCRRASCTYFSFSAAPMQIAFKFHRANGARSRKRNAQILNDIGVRVSISFHFWCTVRLGLASPEALSAKQFRRKTWNDDTSRNECSNALHRRSQHKFTHSMLTRARMRSTRKSLIFRFTSHFLILSRALIAHCRQ